MCSPRMVYVDLPASRRVRAVQDEKSDEKIHLSISTKPLKIDSSIVKMAKSFVVKSVYAILWK